MSREFSKLLVSAVVSWVCLAAGQTHGAVLGTYTFAGADPAGDTNTPAAPNLTFSPFSRVNVVTVAVPDLFRSAEWTLGGSQDTAEFVQFTVAPAAGYALSLSGISFDVKRSVDKASAGEKDGPFNAQIQIFQGVSLTLKGTQNFGPIGIWQNVTFDFADFTTLEGETVTIRFYGWNAGHKNGVLDLDNVTVNGSSPILVVPEPSSTVFMAMGFLMFVMQCLLRARW